MMKWVKFLVVALIGIGLLASLSNATVYTNGVASGAGSPTAISTAAAVEACPPRSGRYSETIVSTVPANCAWGEITGPPSPEPSSNTGFPISANQPYTYGNNSSNPDTGVRGNTAAELDCISTSGSGLISCVESVSP
jgi:hypothetical protein